MADKDLTIEKVVATVRERGPMANREICAALGCYGDGARVLDRLLQKARKQGLLRVVAGRWVAADYETADAQIARLTRERDEARDACAAGSAAHQLATTERDMLSGERDAALADRDSLRAKLAALTAEHESAARAAEERIGRLAAAMEAAALHVGHRVSCGVHADPMAACDCGYGAVWERYAAVLKEVRS